MNDTKPSRRIFRSIIAVVAGFLVTALLSIGVDLALHSAGVFPPSGKVMASGLFVLAMSYRLIFTVLGGYTTARLAPARPMKHVLLLGGIGTLIAIAGAMATWNEGPQFGPKWYPLALVISAIPCVWLGGKLAGRQNKQAVLVG